MARMIALEAGEDWEIASAVLIALLAHPNDRDVERRMASGCRVHGRLVNLMIERGRDSRSFTPQQHYAREFAEKARSGPRDEVLARHSMAAGANALRAVYGDCIRLPKGVRDSLDGVGDWFAEDIGMDRRNYQARVWARTRPVLNLATAFCFLLIDRGLAAREGILFEVGLYRAFVEAWVAEANRIAPLIEERCYRRSGTQGQPRFMWTGVQKVTGSLTAAF